MSAPARQLELALDPAPRDADDLLARLRALGLRDVFRLRLTDNRTVMVSIARGELRVHQAFLSAPREVHAAIVRFVQGRTRGARAEARRTIVAFPVPAELKRPRRRPRATELSDRDARALARLEAAHAELNRLHFAGALRPVEIRLSTRMRSRLGHYAPAAGGDAAHIAINRRHLRRDGWAAAADTLLHEMIHQWQSEQGWPLDHRARFKAKARAVGLASS